MKKYTHKLAIDGTITDLIFINALSILLMLTLLMAPDSPLRVILGIPFLLFFPGYTMIGALFPGKKDIGELERFALSLCLSLAIVPLIGLLLNYTPWGIRLLPVITSLFLLTCLLSVASYYRRSKLPSDQKISYAEIHLPKWRALQKIDKLFIIGFLIAVVAVSGVAVYIVTAQKTDEKFTEFYILNSNGKIGDYPQNLTQRENATVTLGVTNHEYQDVTYKIIVNLGNQTIKTIDSIQTTHGMSWMQNCTFMAVQAGEQIRLEFQLYKEDMAEPYRTLQLSINVRSPE